MEKENTVKENTVKENTVKDNKQKHQFEMTLGGLKSFQSEATLNE